MIAESLTKWFSDERNQALIERLRLAGLNFSSELFRSEITGKARPLDGMTFVLTGSLPTLTREEATAQIESAGGKVNTSVSKKTTYVLAGKEAGSKLDKAQKLGVKIIDEPSFLKLMGE